ncbi:Hypp355 [Branchiostoma lanceolatum]|uniref:Hypp355 protein n=1 Tax=Branchiostoma lanceolatum TaxID=7740 RepID=A0A8J9W3C5_BRALA|nr:Hypp355 [Branchiostoma lanceolatum]
MTPMPWPTQESDFSGLSLNFDLCPQAHSTAVKTPRQRDNADKRPTKKTDRFCQEFTVKGSLPTSSSVGTSDSLAMTEQLTTDVMWGMTAATVVGMAAGAYYLANRTVQAPWPKEKQPLAYTRRVQPKKRKIQLPLNSLDDFVPLENLEPVNDVAGFFTSRGNEFSVYSIDWEQESVVFVRPVDGTDLKDHPFFREAQRRNAAEILSIPFSHLQDVVDAIRPKVAHVQNVFVYMTGRCGSTLLTRAVDATSVAQAANEPEIFSIISMTVIRTRRSRQNQDFSLNPAVSSAVGSDEDDMVKLLRNVVTLLNYNLLMADPRHRDVIMYKMKFDVILIGELMYRAFPSAKNIFLYRNGMECLESLIRLWHRSNVVYSLVRALIRRGLWRWAPMIPDYFGCFGDDAKFTEHSNGSGVFYAMALWVGSMHRALELQKMHPEYFFHCLLYYSALARGKEKSLRLLLKRLGLKWNPAEDGKRRR